MLSLDRAERLRQGDESIYRGNKIVSSAMVGVLTSHSGKISTSIVETQ
ncbi:hypothetical protein QE390_003224 [Siphonobacter sp. SORGH_AS 1065]|nr:hypothetical protein [Siphonobacter sp. SORGH_AS_1065]